MEPAAKLLEIARRRFQSRMEELGNRQQALLKRVVERIDREQQIKARKQLSS